MQEKEKENRTEKILYEYYENELPSGLEDTIAGYISSGDRDEQVDEALEGIFFTKVKAVEKPNKNTQDSLRKMEIRLGFIKKPVISLGRKLMRVAAVLIPAALIVGGVYWTFNKDAAVSPVIVAQVTIETSEKNGRNITLPDGSEIQLGETTLFSYNENFLEDRTVTISGEAYFKVSKMDGQTFTVKTSSITVTVLGTEFHMKAETEAETSEITLTTGKVEVAAEGIENITLAPGQHLTYNREYQSVELSEIGEVKLATMRGMSISFYEASTLDEVLHTISTYYNKRLEVMDESIDVNRKMVVPFSGTETIDEVMSMLKLITGDLFDYRIQGDTIKITKPE